MNSPVKNLPFFGYYKQMFGNSSKFVFMYDTGHNEILTAYDFAQARSMGAIAFPSIIIVDEEGHMVCQKDTGAWKR